MARPCILLQVAVAAALVATSVAAECETLMDVLAGGSLEGGGNFTQFVRLLESTGLDGLLDDQELVATIWAPTDQAFDSTLAFLQLDMDAFLREESLMEDTAKLHVAPGTVIPDISQFDGRLPTLMDDQTVRVGYCTRGQALYTATRAILMTSTGTQACKAMVYPIGGVLLPMQQTADHDSQGPLTVTG